MIEIKFQVSTCVNMYIPFHKYLKICVNIRSKRKNKKWEIQFYLAAFQKNWRKRVSMNTYKVFFVFQVKNIWQSNPVKDFDVGNVYLAL